MYIGPWQELRLAQIVSSSQSNNANYLEKKTKRKKNLSTNLRLPPINRNSFASYESNFSTTSAARSSSSIIEESNEEIKLLYNRLIKTPKSKSNIVVPPLSPYFDRKVEISPLKKSENINKNEEKSKEKIRKRKKKKKPRINENNDNTNRNNRRSSSTKNNHTIKKYGKVLKNVSQVQRMRNMYSKNTSTASSRDEKIGIDSNSDNYNKKTASVIEKEVVTSRISHLSDYDHIASYFDSPKNISKIYKKEKYANNVYNCNENVNVSDDFSLSSNAVNRSSSKLNDHISSCNNNGILEHNNKDNISVLLTASSHSPSSYAPRNEYNMNDKISTKETTDDEDDENDLLAWVNKLDCSSFT